MPPRGGRGRGRGRGRWATRGSTRGGRVAKSTPRSNRTRRNSLGHVNGHYRDQNDGLGVHAIFQPSGLLIIAGLQPEQFPDYDSAQDEGDDTDSHSDYGSATAKTPRKLQNARDRLQDADDAQWHASNPGNDDDWTETEVEVFVAPKTRGFYRPPARREVVRKRVKRVESSRYNDAIPKLQREPTGDDADGVDAIEEDDDPPSRRSSQRSNQVNQPIQDLPIIIEHEATDEEVPEAKEPIEPKPKVTEASRTPSTARGRRGGYRGKKVEKPEKRERPTELLDEGELSDSWFPDAFLKRPATPPLSQCEDRADWIMRKKFAPMGDPQAFIAALTKIDPSTRSTDVLYDIALNAQRALKAWQDEYLMLDQKTAPKSNPPKKPLTGGRNTIDPDVYDDMLEADLYGYNFDAKKLPGHQDPFRQRPGGGKFIGGRELRQRRGRDVGAVDLSEPEATDTGGYGTRRRRAAQRTQNYNELQVPQTRGVKRVSSAVASDYDLPPRKRGRPSAADKNLMQSRIQQLREESLAVSTSSEPDGKSPEPPRRRGRPPGSKNTQPRSDAGIKKGPRKPRLSSAPVENDDVSQSGLAARANAATPTSHPSGDDPMIIDEIPPAAMNGIGDYMPKQAQMNGQAPTPSQDSLDTPPASKLDTLKDKDPKKRVRSEKRSKSMTEWWAARKAKAAEDRKLQLAQQAEADRVAEEQARAAHAAHQAQFPPQDARYWPQIAPQHAAAQQAYPRPTSPPFRMQQRIYGKASQENIIEMVEQGLRPPSDLKYVDQELLSRSALKNVAQPAPQEPTQVLPPEPHRRLQQGPALGPPPQVSQGPLPGLSQRPAQGPAPGLPQTHLQELSRGPLERPPQDRAQVHPLGQLHHIPSAPLHHHHHHSQGLPPPPPPRQDAHHGPPPLPAGHPQGLPGQGLPPSQGPLSHHQHRMPGPPQSSSLGHPLGPPLGPPAGPPGSSQGPPQALPPLAPPSTLAHHSHTQHRPPTASYAGSPPPLPPPQHIFHHHTSGPPQPPISALAQFSPPPAPQTPSQLGAARQASPLRRIINYVSDPSKAAQPSGPPYQSIMTPGASSPTIIQHHGRPSSRPSSRGRTPPSSAAAGSFMGAFHVNNHAARPPIPGTGSFRPETPGKTSSASGLGSYTGPGRPQGRMTGAQVQDLALAAVQPVQRKSLDDILKERERDWKFAEPPPASEDRRRVLFKLQPMPPNEQGPPPPSSAHEREREPPPPSSLHHHHHRRELSGPKLPSFGLSRFSPFAAARSPPASSPRLDSRPPTAGGLASSSSAASGTQGPQLPSLAMALERDRDRDGPLGGLGRHRSVSGGTRLGPPFRIVELAREVKESGEAGERAGERRL